MLQHLEDGNLSLCKAATNTLDHAVPACSLLQQQQQQETLI
jgi:hypothetical protein